MSAIDVLAEGLAHPEGPDLLADGRIVFVESFRGRISAWSAERGIHLFAAVDGVPCACTLGIDGVYLTQAGRAMGEWQSPNPAAPSIQKVTWEGQVVVVAESAEREPLLAPNDLAFGHDGRLYFTDPGPFDPDHPTNGRICAVGRDGSTNVLEEVGPAYPNGITVEADGSVVWTESYTRRVRRLRVDGTVELITTLPESHIPDGLKVGEDDNLYIATVTSGGIDVVAPTGELVRFIEAGVEPLNCVFEGRSLIVTDFGHADGAGLAAAPARGRLLRVRVGVSGRPLPRAKVAGLIDA
jgi:gluconolactonase